MDCRIRSYTMVMLECVAWNVIVSYVLSLLSLPFGMAWLGLGKPGGSCCLLILTVGAMDGQTTSLHGVIALSDGFDDGLTQHANMEFL